MRLCPSWKTPTTRLIWFDEVQVQCMSRVLIRYVYMITFLVYCIPKPIGYMYSYHTLIRVYGVLHFSTLLYGIMRSNQLVLAFNFRTLLSS